MCIRDRNNVVLDNCSFGIHYENTYLNKSTPAEAVISANAVKGNNWCKLPAKADIGIVSAQNAKVFGNTTGSTSAHPARDVGIIARDRGLGPATGHAIANVLGGDELKVEGSFSASNNKQ